MKKVLQIIKNWPHWARLVFWLGGSFLLSLIILWSLWAWFLSGNAWLSLPLKLRAKVAYAKLAASAYREPSCHEHCLIERQSYKQIIAAASSSSLRDKLERTIINEDENQSLRIELIRSLALSDPMVMPDYIKAYLESDIGDSEIKQTIIEEFAPSENPSVIGGLKNIIEDQNQTEASRLQAFQTLAVASGESYAPFFLKILENDSSLKMRDRAISILSNFEHPEYWLDKKSFESLVGILNNPETDNHLRRHLAMLLSEYFNINQGGLEKVYIIALQNENVDKFTKAYLAEFMNHRASGKYEVPDISPAEWSAYAEQAIDARPLAN